MDRRNRFSTSAGLLAAVLVIAGAGACAKSSGS